MQVLKAIGNTRANSIWEADLAENAKPSATSSPSIKANFIRAKYVQRLYLQPISVEPVEGLLSACENQSVQDAVCFLAHGGNEMLRTDEGRKALKSATENESSIMVNLLMMHGAEPEVVKPAHVNNDATSSNGLLISGWLMKRSRKNKNKWSKRWCALDEFEGTAMLRVFKPAFLKSPSLTIPLTDVLDVQKTSESGDTDCGCELHLWHCIYSFAANSPYENLIVMNLHAYLGTS
jgi:hypothetical protein